MILINRIFSGFTILLIILILHFPLTVFAQDSAVKIYVSPAGNDKAPGSKEYPVATLNGALQKMRDCRSSQKGSSPVEVIIGNGSYFLSEPVVFGPEDSGTPEAPVVFKAGKGANPVFYGGKKISGFEKVSEKLWRAKIPEVTEYGWNFEQLYVNGQRAVRAKSPNKGFYFIDGASEISINKKNEYYANLAVQKLKLKQDGMRDISSFTEDDFGNAVLTFYHKWDNTRRKVSGFDRDSSLVFMVGEGMRSWNVFDNKTRYTIENFKAALDTCGEWFLDKSGYLYYMPLPGETIGELQVMASVTNRFIVISGDEKSGKKVENIKFEGLSFRVSGYQMPVSGDEPAQAAFPVDAVVMADFARNIEFSDCEISNTGANAAWFRNACSDCRIQHCYFHDLGAGGIKIGNYVQPENPENLTRNIVVDNNIIRSGGFVFPCAVGITIFNASDNQVTHNEIADFRYSGVSVGWVWGYTPSPSKRNKIEFNHIHHLGWGELCDMGGVYCLGSSEGTTVSNNVIHHVYSFDYGGWGLYTDEGSTGIVMENNLVYHCKSSGFHQHYGKENIIRNNIFADNLKAQLQATRIEEHLSFTFTSNIVYFSTGKLLDSNWDKINIQSDRNCYWDSRTKDIQFKKMSFGEWQKTGKDIHSIIADPEFVNPSAYDFRIKNKSVLRKTGFKEFDYSQAGVYGTEEWKKLAIFNTEKAQQFEEAIINNEKRKQ